MLSNASTIILLVSEGSPGAGPPPVFLCAFFLAELLLGRAEEPFPFLFYFVDGSAGYTNGINLLCNGFPCFSFGFIRHIVGKLALQDAFICLHVSVIIVNSRVVKFGFLFLFSALFPVCSSESMSTRLIQIQKKIRPSFPSQCFNPRQPARIALNFPAKPVCQVGIPFAGRFIPRIANLFLE